MELALIASNISMILVFVLRYATFPPQIPLFYVHQAGEDQLGEWWMIFLIPFFLDLFYFLNKFVHRRFFHENKFVGRVLHYFNLFLIVVFTLIFMRIIILIS